MDTRQYENETEYDIDYEKKNTSYSKEKLNKIISEYRITQNNFNPNKRTPPNSFISKLEYRMQHYYLQLSRK